MKTIDEIQEELVDNDYHISFQTAKDLAWHLEHDEDPHMAVVLATDSGLKIFDHLIAKHLDHDNWFVRERTVGCVLDRLKLAEYAEKGLEMAQCDEDESVRNMAVFSLGAIINEIPFSLAQKIASYILEVLQHHENKVDRDSAYFSILKAMEVPREKRPRVSRTLQKEDTDSSTIEKFCKKYGLTNCKIVH